MALENVGPNVKSPKPKGLLFEPGKLDGAVVGVCLNWDYCL